MTTDGWQLHFLIQFPDPVACHDFFPLRPQGVFPERVEYQGNVDHFIQIVAAHTGNKAAWEFDVVLFHHFAKFANPFRIEFFQIIKGDAVADAVVKTENKGKTV